MKIILSFLFLFAFDLYAVDFFNGDTSLAINYFYAGDDLIEQAQYDSALFYLQKAERIFYENKLWDMYVSSLNRISHSLRELGHFDSSLVISKKALEFGLEFCKERKIIARTYNQLGYTYKNLGDFSSALFNGLKGKKILENYPPDKIKAENYSLLGQIEKERSEYDSSVYFFEKAIETKFEVLGKTNSSVGTDYNNLALTLEEKGDHDRARWYFFKSLKLKIKELGDKHADVATLYSNIGSNYFYRGENDLALEYYLKSLSIDEEILESQHPKLGYRYNNIAMAYRVNGDYVLALNYAFKSRDIFKKNFGVKHPNYASVINNIGRIYSDKKEYDKALEFFISSYEIFKDVIGDSHPVTAQIQNNIGETYTKKGDYEKGLEYLKKSLAIRINSLGSKHSKVAVTLTEIGKNYYYQNLIDSALYYLQQAVIASTDGFDGSDLLTNPDLSSRGYDKELLDALFHKAETLNKNYVLSGNVTNLQNSLETYELCSKLAVKMRQSYKSESSKLSIDQTGYDIILAGISAAKSLYDITGDEAYLETAFEFAENGKAGMLSDALAEANAKNFSGIPDSLLRKEKQLRIDLTSYDTQIRKEKEKKNGIDSTKLQKLENSFFALHREYEDMINYFEKNNYKYYHLKYSDQNYSVKQIQNSLSDNSAIIEYVISNSVLYIFQITKNKNTVIKVLLDRPLRSDVLSFRNALYNIDFETYTKTAHKLYSVLIKPIENELNKIDKLYIIPDGILNYLPFESLLTTQERGSDFSKMSYLINNYDISYYFSAPTLFDMKLHKDNSNKSFAGFAPVFPDDPETKTMIASVIDTSITISSTRFVNIEGKIYSSLPKTENEVNQVSELFNSKGLSSKIFLRSLAKENFIKSDLLKDFDIIHIASHGFINEKKPKLSGILFWNDSSDTNEDGILYSGEIYNLNLDADLLVLSACETGLGKIVRGEGIIGLTRGFTYAGARNIVVSLWQVADKSTSELMIEFYKNILDGDNYSSSLRNAKLKLIKDGKYSYPLEWAPFVLIGK